MNRRTLAAMLAALLLAPAAHAGERRPVYAPGGVALGGVDPVGYFTEGRRCRAARTWRSCGMAPFGCSPALRAAGCSK